MLHSINYPEFFQNAWQMPIRFEQVHTPPDEAVERWALLKGNIFWILNQTESTTCNMPQQVLPDPLLPKIWDDISYLKLDKVSCGKSPIARPLVFREIRAIKAWCSS